MNATAPKVVSSRPVLRGYEQTVLCFFLLLAVAGFWRSISFAGEIALLLSPLPVWWLCRLEEQRGAGWARVLREWISLAAIPLAYWSLELFAKPSVAVSVQDSWVLWDRQILNAAGMRRIFEALGPVIPVLLETAYLLLYAIPPISLGLLYAAGERRQAPRFLEVLFLGTLTAYILILVVPTQSPRVAFAGQDLPAYNGFPRSLNVWLLDHLDISTSVFPSGHVAVAFSCAFGLFRAVPRRPRVWMPVLITACLVFLATIYGRYHYAVDGLASIAIALVAWGLADRIWPDDDAV
ncbi:MAG: phosphatase PAP2 family protein [Acidobacteria bacterium]|nr:phosphatase PAP2 family protein [Acidobacteriota bacterium]